MSTETLLHHTDPVCRGLSLPFDRPFQGVQRNTKCTALQALPSTIDRLGATTEASAACELRYVLTALMHASCAAPPGCALLFVRGSGEFVAVLCFRSPRTQETRHHAFCCVAVTGILQPPQQAPHLSCPTAAVHSGTHSHITPLSPFSSKCGSFLSCC